MPMLEVDGVRLYYTVKGEGIPIIFIHPPLLTSENFSYQLEGLAQTFKIITFDIRGHGRSQYSNKPLTYPLIVEDMKRILDHLEIDKAYICGYSTGGSILLEFILRYKEKSLGGIVISGMSETSDLYLKQRISLAIKLADPKTLPLLARAISWGNADTKETYKKLYDEAIKGDSRNIKQYYQYSLQYNCTNQLKSINVPIFLVYGNKDKAFHRYARTLKKGLPKYELEYLLNEKHQIPTKAAAKLNRLIRVFIEKNN
nr:alpha/beta hydrolase [Neobacillus sp. Marseille-Q6967]